jgi:hypothetical protein
MIEFGEFVRSVRIQQYQMNSGNVETFASPRMSVFNMHKLDVLFSENFLSFSTVSANFESKTKRSVRGMFHGRFTDDSLR